LVLEYRPRKKNTYDQTFNQSKIQNNEKKKKKAICYRTSGRRASSGANKRELLEGRGGAIRQGNNFSIDAKWEQEEGERGRGKGRGNTRKKTPPKNKKENKKKKKKKRRGRGGGRKKNPDNALEEKERARERAREAGWKSRGGTGKRNVRKGGNWRYVAQLQISEQKNQKKGLGGARSCWGQGK